MWYYAGHSTKCNTTICQLNTICLICLHGTKCSTIAWPWGFRVESCLWLLRGFLGPNPTSGCVADFQGRILVTVPNAFSGSSFISSVCAHAVFERSIDKEWHNPTRTSSDGRDDPLELLWPRKGSLMKRQTRILDNRLYYTRKIELHRKGKKSRTVRITPIVICPSGNEISVLITVRRVHYIKMGKVPTTGTKLPGCWQLTNKKNSPSTINNHLLCAQTGPGFELGVTDFISENNNRYIVPGVV